MAKILFATPSDLRCEALGPMMLSAVLKKAGHEVTLWDAMRDQEMDFVLYSLVAGGEPPPWEHFRLCYKDAIHIAGGPLITYSDERVTPDWVVEMRGPAELDLKWLVANGPGVTAGGRPLCGYPKLDKLPWPDRELYPQFTKSPMKRFITARGCDWRCSYCFNSKEHKLYPREERRQRRPVDDVIDEVLYVRDRWGLEMAYFNDDDLARDDEWLREFCKRWPVEVGLPFVGSVRAENISSRKAYRLGKAGCTWMNMALESAATETLKLLRRPPNQAKVYSATRNLQRYGVKVRLQNMIGLPVKDPLEDALQTLQFNQDINPADSWCAIYQPLPGTDLHTYCLNEGYLEPGMEAGSFTTGTTLMWDKDPGLAGIAIDRLHKWWHLAVRGRWSRDLIELVLDLDLGDHHKDFQNLRWKEGAKLLYGGLV